jgi:hypothetical protein
MIYKIYEEELDIYYELTIHEIIHLIKTNKENTFYKFVNNQKIKINNNIILKTEFICHRINTVNELKNIDKTFGVEIDIRDDHKSGKLILAHDPFVDGEYFEDYLKIYNHKTLILNIKSEHIELACLKLLEVYNIHNYFFLDSSFPMIYLLNKEYKNNNIAYRFSEYEPLNDDIIIKNNMYKYIWIDCFTIFPLNKEDYELIKKTDIKICIVSPELQKQHEKIEEYRNIIINENIIPDMICCKDYNIIYWI